MDEPFLEAAPATTTSDVCILGADEIGAGLPLSWVIGRWAEEEVHEEAGVELEFIELDTSGPFIYRLRA
jgi:hypothetical protein